MSGAGVVVLVVIVVIVVWWIDVRWHPVRRCPSCKGSKRNTGSTATRWGTCGRCGGTGEVRRFGGREQ
jgi:hypothetical protein